MAEIFEEKVRALIGGHTRLSLPPLHGVMLMMEEQARIEADAAMLAGLSNEMRQFNAGRAAGVRDVLAMVEGELTPRPEGDSGSGLL